MDIIPVLDIKKGMVVHGKSGERETYQPLVSKLTKSQDPVTVARDLGKKLNVKKLYVADLDAIENNSTSMDVVNSLSRGVEGKILLDAGITSMERLKEIRGLDNIQVVIGTETISTLHEFDALAHGSSDNLTISLDIKHNRLLTKCQELSQWSLSQIFKYLTDRNFNEFILLDLDAVGTEKGVDTKWVESILDMYPQVRMILGGGVANIRDLYTLKKAGVTGALVGTALHSGAIRPEDVLAIMEKGV